MPVHCPEVSFGRIEVLLLVGGMLQQALVRADRQSRVHRPGLVGRVLHLVERDLQQVRQSLAAVLGLGCEALPAGLAKGVVGLLEAARRLDRAARRIVGAAFFVAAAIDRQQLVLAELAGLLDDLVHRVGVEVSVARHLPEHVDRTEHFVQNELLVA